MKLDPIQDKFLSWALVIHEEPKKEWEKSH